MTKRGYELDEDSFINHLLKDFAYIIWPSLAQKYDIYDDLNIYSTTNPAFLALDYAMLSVAESLLAGLDQLLLEEDIEPDFSEIPFTSSNIENTEIRDQAGHKDGKMTLDRYGRTLRSNKTTIEKMESVLPTPSFLSSGCRVGVKKATV